MEIIVADTNGNTYAVQNVGSYELAEHELVINDLMDRPKAIFERAMIIGFKIER